MDNIVQDDIKNLVIDPIKNKSDILLTVLIGTITHDITVKTSKAGNIWTEVKILIEEEHPHRVQLKLFGDEAQQVSELYHKGDTLLVIGEPRSNAFISKNKEIVNRLDVFPSYIQKIGSKATSESKPIILK